MTDPVRRIWSHLPGGVPPAPGSSPDTLAVEVMDEPGPGGACHLYRIAIPERALTEEEARRSGFAPGAEVIEIVMLPFQKGAIQEAGFNGITNEALLAVVQDRLERFQEGPFHCDENDEALTHVREALDWLHVRTQGRRSRGVEGRSVE